LRAVHDWAQVDAVRARVADAQAKLDREQYLKGCGISKDLHSLSLEPDIWRQCGNETDRHNERFLRVLRRWVDGDFSLYVVGAPGTGKTAGAVAAALDCMRRNPPEEVLFLPEAKLIDAFGRKSDSNLWTRAGEVQTLVIDDIGRHQVDRGTRYLAEKYLDILDERCPVLPGRRKKTLFTSQMNPAKLALAFSDGAINGRLFALLEGKILEIQGPDRRKMQWSGWEGDV